SAWGARSAFPRPSSTRTDPWGSRASRPRSGSCSERGRCARDGSARAIVEASDRPRRRELKKRAKAARPGARARTAAPRPAQRAQAGGADAKKMALLVAEAGLDKKATEIEIIDVTGK